MTTAVAVRRRTGRPAGPLAGPRSNLRLLAHQVRAGPLAGPRSNLRLLAHQVRYEQLSFWRNPQSAIFTFIFPVVFVVIMGALFGGTGKSSYFGGLSALQYYVPTIAALSVLGSCYGQLAVALAARRQAGILKRVRATPLPAWAYFGGLLAHCVLVSVVDIALIVVVGRLYGVPFPSHWLTIMLTLVLGAASFCALGVAVASVISNADAAPAVAQLVLFPLTFIAGTYGPIHSALLNHVSGWLPVRPFNEALTGAFAQHAGGKSSYFGGLSALQYYVPTIAALSVLGSCYGQLAVALAARRQAGILKRIRATPLPAWAYFGGLLAHCVLVSVIDIALIVVVGRLYGVPFPSHWLAIMLTLVLGAASFCALGVAVASVISNADAAPAVAQLVLFPLTFIAGTYGPIHSALLNHVSGWLPVRPFNEALTGAFAQHAGADWRDLAVLAAWGVAGAGVAVRRFRWDPRPE